MFPLSCRLCGVSGWSLSQSVNQSPYLHVHTKDCCCCCCFFFKMVMAMSCNQSQICISTQKAYAPVLPGLWLVQLKRNAFHGLHHLCGRCTLIDPRPQKISKSQRKWLKSFASSQPNVQHCDTSSPSATTTIPPTSSDLQAQACLPQHASSELQQSIAAAPAAGALPAVTPATELSCSATYQDSAQAQVSAAVEDSLPDSAPAQACASEAQVPADAAQAQACASEAEVLADTAQAQASVPHEGQQSCTARSQQPESQVEGCWLQQSGSLASAQHRRPDLRGTLSNQVQVGLKLLAVSAATPQSYWQRMLITLLKPT